jgi:predicted DNA-binding WGR domain protein
MSDAAPSPTYLERVDAERNMARFYCLSVQPTLFGEFSLIRCWGRIGTGGRDKIETFEHSDHVAVASHRIELQKRRRGYVDP